MFVLHGQGLEVGKSLFSMARGRRQAYVCPPGSQKKKKIVCLWGEKKRWPLPPLHLRVFFGA